MLIHELEVIAEYDEPGDADGNLRLANALMDWASRDYDHRIVSVTPGGWTTACRYTVQAASPEKAKELALNDFAGTKLTEGISGPRTVRAEFFVEE